MSDKNTRLSEARQALLDGRYSVAYEIYEELLGQNPEDGQVLMDYGRAKYREYKDLAFAAELFDRALSASPDRVQTLLWLADICSLGYGRGYSAAADLYRQAIRLDPNTTDAYIGLGMLHRAPDPPVSLSEAVSVFRKAAELDPNRSDALINLGMALVEIGDLQRAHTTLLTAQRLLDSAGEQRQAKGIGSFAMRILKEGIKSSAYSYDSPRFRWPA